MANDSANSNGAGPASDEGDNTTPFERFERLTKQLLTVPKEELDKRVKQAKRTSRRRAAHHS